MAQNDQDTDQGMIAGKAGIWSRRARGVYIAELIVFALPATVFYGYCAILIGTLSGSFFLENAWLTLLNTGGVTNIQRIVGGAIGIGIFAMIISALWIFLSLSIDYVRARHIEWVAARRRYWRGLWLALFPLLTVVYGIIVSVIDDSMRGFLPVLSYSLGVLIPVTHLGFALYATGSAPQS